jgi:adenylate cyclase
LAHSGIGKDGKNPADLDIGQTVSHASVCGQHMLEVVQEIVNPALEERGVEADLEIGVGIDVGEVIITRIGLPIGFEVTAYGDAINRASKICSKAQGAVYISNKADSAFPSGPGGTVRTFPVLNEDAYRLEMPPRMG